MLGACALPAFSPGSTCLPPYALHPHRRKNLGKRVGQNLELLEEVEAGVAAALGELGDPATLQPPGGACASLGACAVPCLDWREALAVGDCLCLGLDVERPEAAIMDPSRLVIKAIQPTRITAESFMDALSFALSGRSGADVHGGFGRGAGARVVAGEGREPITGALPLYICPQHWSVARLHAKPLLAWMCTLSPLVSAWRRLQQKRGAASRAGVGSPAAGQAPALCLAPAHAVPSGCAC